MPQRKPLSPAEQAFLTRLAHGNALSLQHQAERDAPSTHFLFAAGHWRRNSWPGRST
ncbi:hypothetical protein [Halomonas lysinitropha]|uniref:Uncharacterized protein n=1 Tax=Halomonas lysinitropha TaxID=2607506 RepID=A0A5K1I6M2_9GAMM|nr:hypothetical protein [Halomonas lysinitropha]VVZ95560.1 hypothetical protein HALO32_01633 [Halomonas lysinitropha]